MIAEADIAEVDLDPSFVEPESEPEPLRAVHTPNFPGLLRQLEASLLVTTYQAGKFVLVRDEGEHLNTRFRSFQAPMGLALQGDRLAIGTECKSGSSITSRPSPPSSTGPLNTMPASFPAPATLPATSRSMRWPGAAETSSGM
jgi:hypothetical protein